MTSICESADNNEHDAVRLHHKSDEVRVHNERALHFSLISKPAPVLEYVKAISSIIGASHILAVFEENDSVKVFFDDKKYIDSLITSGVHVLGRHVKADYVVPPGTKIVLSTVDPVISNVDVMRLLAMYGTVVSPVVCHSISDDIELCHIENGVRHVYMKLNVPPPTRLEFKYGDQICHIKIARDDNPCQFLAIKHDIDEDNTELNVNSNDSSPGPSTSTPNPFVLLQDSDGPVVVSVQSTASDSEEQTESNELHLEAIPVSRGGHYTRTLHSKRKRMTATTRAAKRIKRNVKHKWGAKRLNHFKRCRQTRKFHQPPVLSPMASTSYLDASTLPLSIDENKFESPNEAVLDAKNLQLFIKEVKNKRSPFDLAKKFLGENCDNENVNKLIDQLAIYKSSLRSTSLKIRITRLMKSLKDAM